MCVVLSDDCSISLSNEPSVNSTTPTNAALTLPYLSHWLYAITSVPLYIAALTVFLFGRRVFSSFSLALLTPLVCVCLGGMLQTNVLVYYHYYLLEDILTPPPLSVHVQTAGGLSALCLLVSGCTLCDVWCIDMYDVGSGQ